MFKKRTYYLSALLLTLPLVANAGPLLFAPTNDLRPLLENLNTLCAPLPVSLDEKATHQLQNFYDQREGQPAWQNSAQLLQLNEQIEHLADDGLLPDEYPLPLLANVHIEQPACADLLTSHSYLQALLHLRSGHLPQARLEPQWRAPALGSSDLQLATLSIALLHLNNPAQAFTSARPATTQYQRLRNAYALQRMRPLHEWAALPDGPLLKPQGADERLPALRARLIAQGYLMVQPDDLGSTYDLATQIALERFQQEHGLNPDGILGPASLGELNITAQMRREQLRINLERLRWVADDMLSAEVMINVAASELQVLRNNQVLWHTRTQVGRAERQTPLLASRINRLTLNPTWTVPPTILREDKLPAIRNDIDFLQRSDLTVLARDGTQLDPYSVDWNNPGPITLRQSAGTRNPLGRLVVRFDNPFSVYLHDTPSQHLFSKAPRAFSSGCVRVEAVDSLMAWLLSPDELETVQARITNGKTQQYNLYRPIPLLVTYWTAEARADGSVRYYPDIYGNDASLIKALPLSPPGV